MSKKLSLKDLQQQVKELTEALQRERADAINVRRRAETERQEMANFYKARIIQELLPVIDSTEKLLQHIPDHSKDRPWKEGAEGIVRQAQKTLANLGVERIKTVGEPFDPHFHEAISIEDAGGEIEVVCEELQPGYTVGDSVIRHAMVKVKKGDV